MKMQLKGFKKAIAVKKREYFSNDESKIVAWQEYTGTHQAFMAHLESVTFNKVYEAEVSGKPLFIV
jgi:predicted metal-binding protein